jgi:hypothetical protein
MSNIKKKLVELESSLSNDSPDSLVKLNQQNPKRISRQMLFNLIPDLPVNDECGEKCKKFYEYILNTNMVNTKKGIAIRNQIDGKIEAAAAAAANALRAQSEANAASAASAASEPSAVDDIVEDAIEDGIENAVEKFVEESLENAGENADADAGEDAGEDADADEDADEDADDEDPDMSRVLDEISKLSGKIDILMNLIKDVNKNSDNALQTSLMVKDKMSDHSKKIDDVSKTHAETVLKMDHLGRVLEMFNKEEVEGRKETAPKKDVVKKKEDEASARIRAMLGLA